MIQRLRTFLIKLLAGDDMVIVNADIRGCTLEGDKGGYTLAIGCKFTREAESSSISPWNREDHEAFRKMMRKVSKKNRDLQRKFKR